MRLINQSEYFRIHQCDCKRCFYFESQFETTWLTFCELLALRHKINLLDLRVHFEEENHSGYELIEFCNKKCFLVLDTYELIDLKAFIRETFSQLEGKGMAASL